MLYGGLSGADTSKEVIEVPDVEPVAFLTMLKYLYCDEINLTPDNVLATLYCAKKYIVPHLVIFNFILFVLNLGQFSFFDY